MIISDSEKDPYTVENMNKALRMSLAQKRGVAQASIDKSIYKLEPNFLYVRFLANGKQGEAELKMHDTSLVLFKHPMDYKPIQKPVVYIDPSLPDSVIPYFATVPADYAFGSTKYEVIKELFLVEPLDGDCEEELACDTEIEFSNRILQKAGNKNSAVFRKMQNEGVSLQEVEKLSLEITGNIEQERFKNETTFAKTSSLKQGWSFPGSTWKPKGTLKFMDDQLGEQPLVGVRIIGGYSYYWREAHTDNKGYFSIPENWSYSIDYGLNFDSPQFLLEDGHSIYGEDLEIEKNNKKSAWNETFTGDKAKWSIVWTAACQYFHGEIYGLKRSRQNEWWNQSLDIWVYYKNNKDYIDDVGDSDGEYAYSPITERIAVRGYEGSSLDIYTTTIHEIAHSSHYWNMKTTNVLQPQVQEFANLPRKLKESYTRGIEWFLTNKRYGAWNSLYKKAWQPSYWGNYTGIFQDLVDSDGRDARNKINETVSGFTIPQLEKALFQVKSLNAFMLKLQSLYPSKETSPHYSEDSLQTLFNYWSDL